MTGGTAEKHDAFFEPKGDGTAVDKFDGVQLVQQEPDASSFPNGGIRNTFEARGYTAWDPSSPAFMIGTTLCIPTIFVSYTGEALDNKVPLLRALQSIDHSATEVARYFDKNVNKVIATLGWEQEYFLVDSALAASRPDRMMAGRLLLSGGQISGIGAVGAGTREVDARGQVLCPGFVDTHSHDDGAFLRYPGMAFKLAQGVTSEISGNCGFSTIPNEPGREYMPGDISGPGSGWTDVDSYFAACIELKPAINNAMLVGHHRIRAHVVGLEKRLATATELAEMRGHVAKAMEQGAVGFSTELIYETGRYSNTEEVVALA